jgi:hypothetical protein
MAKHLIITYFIIIFLMPMQTFAKAPECPLYNNKQECLHSVESNYNEFLDFINENTEDENLIERDKLIQASLDIKKYEMLACQKTCLD